ncbi:MAG TPA: 2Fe-2S iron-sulfur cluster-binding protein [Sandaracinaceae bacterium LLY-WYZ-13_1]|nr:2Fe-2S iron-sulfur cluster-binding protein [Sandaracinaceae bacterium LLY-WYZ-13_1]
MAPRRLRPVEDPVHLEVDGARIEARDGEPVAVALAAAGRLVLGRSVKYHRPRGAACYAGRCDGCLMRVDGVPSVMTCRLPASDGLVAETQNVVGSARRDLLAATDWFFRGGMNHHEMFTWNEQVNKVMQKVARRIAGIGELPAGEVAPRPVHDDEVDVLVIGGGPAGLRAATRCAEAGLHVTLLDEESVPGGSLRWWPRPLDFEGAARTSDAIAERMVARAWEAEVRVMPHTSAVGAYDPWEDVAGAGDPPIAAPARRAARPIVLADGPDGLVHLRPRRVVVAAGRHEGASAFAGNDRPGVIELRAACRLLAWGVLPGERVLLAGADPGLEALAEALREAGAEVLGPFAEGSLREAKGRPEVGACELEVDGRARELACDAVVVAPPTSAVYEVAAQLGVATQWSGTGFEVAADPAHGATDAADVRVVGWAAGVHGLADTLAQADAAAAAVVEELS